MKKHNWMKTDGRCYLKCLAVALRDTGLRGEKLLARFRKIAPNWKREFDGPISDNAVVQRADKGRRYETEWPENNPRTAPHWKRAVRDAKRGRCSFDFEAARARAAGAAQPRRAAAPEAGRRSARPAAVPVPRAGRRGRAPERSAEARRGGARHRAGAAGRAAEAYDRTT